MGNDCPSPSLPPPSEFRHYNISVRPVGISRSVKAVLSSQLPDLSQFQDISDFVLRCGVEDSVEAARCFNILPFCRNTANYESDAELAGDNRVGVGSRETDCSCH